MSSRASKSGAEDDLGSTKRFIRPIEVHSNFGLLVWFGDAINDRRELSSDSVGTMPRTKELGIGSVSFMVCAVE